VIEFVAGISILAAALFAALWWRARARLRKATLASELVERNRDALAAVLASVPAAGFRWGRDAPDAMPLGRLPGRAGELSYEQFLAWLDPADAAHATAALDALKWAGTGFTATVSAPDGGAYQIEGCPIRGGEAALWITDLAPVRRLEEARAAAAEAAAGLREVLNVLPLPVWRRDAGLRLVDCNDAYAAVLDLPRDAVLTRSGELAAQAGADQAPSLARAAVAAGSAQSARQHVVVAGARRLLELTETPNRAGGTIGFALDHTDVETARNEKARHVNAHAQVLESIHAAVAIYGPDKRLRFFNSAFVRLWGLETEWLAAEPSLDELLERLRECRRIPEVADFRVFKRERLQMFTSLIEPHSELMHLPDDRTLCLSVSPHPLGGLIFVYEDVTDRLVLERSYNTLIEVQRETLDNLFEGIAVFGSDGRLKLHNPAYRKIWALSEPDLDGEPHFVVMVEKIRAFYDDGGDWPAIRDQVVGQITGRTHWSGPLDRRDGSTLRMATIPLPDGNVLQTCLDITDTARVERALRERNEALETAGRLKSEFIANVSYELRTPLNAIIGFAEILAHQYFGQLAPRQLDYARGILDSSNRLMALINDILDLATIEAGYLALETGRVEVRDMLESVASLTHERVRSQELALQVECSPEIGAIAADERRLKQALFNLVSNAIKFTPPGGAIRLEARFADQPETPPEARDLILAVADTGIGIPASDQGRVFEKFERGNPPTRESGAGLGLSLVKNLIELHGGSVAIESEPGSGTTIVCRLPARLRLPPETAAETLDP
jgi:signal transduction histidine kinase